MVKIYIEREDERKEFEFEGKVSNLLKKLNIKQEEVIIIKDNEIITSDREIKNEDSLKLLSVLSGG
ncbi:MAG: MoaD/ThiS family protein [Candidatus Woesearchaeota archaeon]